MQALALGRWRGHILILILIWPFLYAQNRLLVLGKTALSTSAAPAPHSPMDATRQTPRRCQRALAVPYGDAGIAGAPAAAYGAVRGGRRRGAERCFA
jgi:hypothetical protein